MAQKLIEKLDVAGVCDKVDIAGPGFINLHLSRDFLAAQASAMAADARLGVPVVKPAMRVVLDYGGANLAKEMHVGNMRSAIIGDALDRVLEYQGHEVIRQDHLGDWGTQLGMLIEHPRFRACIDRSNHFRSVIWMRFTRRRRKNLMPIRILPSAHRRVPRGVALRSLAM